jgi:hypothetical protein
VDFRSEEDRDGGAERDGGYGKNAEQTNNSGEFFEEHLERKVLSATDELLGSFYDGDGPFFLWGLDVLRTSD